MILANSPQTLSIGATRLLWKLGFADNLLLPSGQRFLEDPLWRAVADDLGPHVPERILAGLNRHVRQRNLPGLVTRTLVGIDTIEMRQLRAELAQAFAAIARECGREYLIESSSTAAYTVLLNNLPAVTTYNIHLLRHPRAVSYSWARPKPQPETGGTTQMVVRSQRRSDADWLSTNFGIIAAQRLGALGPLVRLTYEQLCGETRKSLTRIDAMLGDEVFSQLDLGALTSAQTKGVGGNPMRFDAGPLQIRYDDRWRSSGHERRDWADRIYKIASRS